MRDLKYELNPKQKKIVVREGSKVIGSIHHSKGGGYHFRSSATTWGETFKTMAELKAELERTP